MFKNINKDEWILIPVKHAFLNHKAILHNPGMMDKHILFPALVLEIDYQRTYFIAELDIGIEIRRIKVGIDGSIEGAGRYKAEPLTLRIFDQNPWIKDYIETRKRKNKFCESMYNLFYKAHEKEIELRDIEKE